jgi:hypothetical protein
MTNPIDLAIDTSAMDIFLAETVKPPAPPKPRRPRYDPVPPYHDLDDEMPKPWRQS